MWYARGVRYETIHWANDDAYRSNMIGRLTEHSAVIARVIDEGDLCLPVLLKYDFMNPNAGAAIKKSEKGVCSIAVYFVTRWR